VYYNLRHKRHGHVFDGRYKAKVVEGDDYLLALSRYVHLNPLQVASMKHKPIEERIKALRAYPWSSYPSYIGSGSDVCNQLNRLPEKLSKDRRLRRLVKQAEERLKELRSSRQTKGRAHEQRT